MSKPQVFKILVIDDEVTQRMLVKEYLEEAGFLVRLAEDGKHGLRMATSLAPDLILLDALLPSIDGYRVCAELRRHPKTADIPIVLITASKEVDAIAKGLAAGATDFITKPVEFQFLADRVGVVLQKAQHVRQLLAHQRAAEEALSAKGTAGAEDRVQSIQAAAEAEVAQSKAEFEREAARIRAEADEKIARAMAEAETSLQSAREEADRELAAVRAQGAQADVEAPGASSLPLSLGPPANADRAAEAAAAAVWKVASTFSYEHLRSVNDIAALAEQALAEQPPGSSGSAALRSLLAGARELGNAFSNFNLLASHLCGNPVPADGIVDIGALVEGCAASVQSICQSQGIAIETALDPALGAVKGNELRLRYMVLQLLANAVKFSPRGARIRIEAMVAADQSVRIAVCDSGLGMTAHTVARLHDPLDPASMITGKGDSVGLGVPIAAAIARVHEAGLVFDSMLGHGTIATIVLPASRNLAAAGDGARAIA